MSGPFFVLNRPWIHSGSKPTGILYGDEDPHVAVHFADTSCLTGCERCEDWGEIRHGAPDEWNHAEDAKWLTGALNYAINHGFRPPPIEEKRRLAALQEEQAKCKHRWQMSDPISEDVCEHCGLQRTNPNARLP